MTLKIEDVHDAFPGRLALENLFDGQRIDQRGLPAVLALVLAHYNFVRAHKTLRMTPAMAAGIEGKLWSLEELVDQATK